MAEPKKQTYTRRDIENFDIPNSGMTGDEYDERMKDDPGGWSRQYTKAELEELSRVWMQNLLNDEDSEF